MIVLVLMFPVSYYNIINTSVSFRQSDRVSIDFLSVTMIVSELAPLLVTMIVPLSVSVSINVLMSVLWSLLAPMVVTVSFSLSFIMIVSVVVYYQLP